MFPSGLLYNKTAILCRLVRKLSVVYIPLFPGQSWLHSGRIHVTITDRPSANEAWLKLSTISTELNLPPSVVYIVLYANCLFCGALEIL